MSENESLDIKTLLEELTQYAGVEGGPPRKLMARILRDIHTLYPHDYSFPGGPTFADVHRNFPLYEKEIREDWEQAMTDFEEGRPPDKIKMQQLWEKTGSEFRESASGE